MARHLSRPSFLTGKRPKLTTVAVASTLAAAAAATTAAAMLPAHSPAASAGSAVTSLVVTRQQQAAGAGQGNVVSPAQRLDAFERVRFGLGEVQYRDDVAAAKEAAASAAQQTAARTPSGSPVEIAQQMLGQFGWSPSEFSCLYPLWEHESGWNTTAENAGSGAYGIPQSLPGSRMASAGRDWQTNPATQIRWGLTYIQGRYGSPCGAWAHEQSDNWY